MTIGLVSKLLQGGCVTASACCVLNFIWEHVVQLIVAIICIIWKGKNPGTRNLAFEVSGPSMIPTFNLKGDGVIVVSEHLSSYFRTIKKGDVVILRSPEKPNNLICKRIAAMGGEFMRTDTDGKDSFEIPKGHLWLLGDNPKYSKDSRDYGPVPYGLIQGRVCFKVRTGLLVIQRCYVIPN
ncbi:mitochondrial inner membrane protease subunit 1-like isoform X1 [Pocillopora damicornis]|uniref:mitochondrial inner membrane protease subunit 1-like isoform X1 n=1 Tax=Pocillopora damicornis TaxID=46731 RepID=UPI000F55046B|nr:mitochondrial inner membrane protease subunit 1-like isoform X1 [Pocillopora damicornis]